MSQQPYFLKNLAGFIKNGFFIKINAWENFCP
jgi:hypothetical protein